MRMTMQGLMGLILLASLAALIALVFAAHYLSTWYAIPAAAIWLAWVLFGRPITPGRDAIWGIVVGALCLAGWPEPAYAVVAAIALAGALVGVVRMARGSGR